MLLQTYFVALCTDNSEKLKLPELTKQLALCKNRNKEEAIFIYHESHLLNLTDSD